MQDENLIRQIREKVDIVDVIGERLPLEKKGKNYFGICPFHDDTSPSLCVSREKQIYTCFSCHATGSVYTFLIDYEHITFVEALQYLGEKVGVDTKNIHVKKQNSKYNQYYEIYDLTVKYYQNNLSTELGKTARSYLEKRGITEEVIKEFQIGLSLRGVDDLTKLLTLKKYDLTDLNTIGLASGNHDVYNNRIMFPLYDPVGRIVAFSGRVYVSEDSSKYINTKETPIFVKGDCLYHYHVAKQECRTSKSVIIMEGFMDVIRASTIGVKNTIALMGTALTNEQVKLIKRLSNQIILCLDGDKAGRNAAYKIGEIFLKENIEVKVVTLPNDDDPDSFILKEGKESFLSYIENAVNYNDYKIKVMKEEVNFNSVQETSDYINRVIEEISTIDDPIRCEIILKKLAKDFNIGYNTLEKKFLHLKKNNQKQKPQLEVKRVSLSRKNKYRKAVEQVIYFMLTNDWVISEVEREKLLISDLDVRILVKEIIYYYKKYGSVTIADFITYLSDKSELLISLNSIISCSYSDQLDKETLYLYFRVIREDSLNRQIKVLEKKLKEELDPKRQAMIGNEIRALRIGDNING